MMIMGMMLCRSFCAVVLLLASAAVAVAGEAPASAAPPADKPFVVRAIVAGQTIVEAGKLATAKATDKVKPLATRVVTDHAKVNATLMSLAEQRGIQPPQSRTERHRRTIEKLQNLQGNAFDRAFADVMVEDYRDVLALFKRQVEYGKDADVRTFASDNLPILEANYKSARDLSKQLAAATTTSRPAK